MSRTRLALTRLEDRTVPAAYGTPWPDAGRLTLSFAPDGTNVGGAASNLVGTFGNANAWQLTMLRAFQTWAVNANVNVRVVGDGGQAFGGDGSPQGDARFGDVRIGGLDLGADEYALASPYSPM